MFCIFGKLFSPSATGISFSSVLRKIPGFTGVQITIAWMFLYCYRTVTVAAITLILILLIYFFPDYTWENKLFLVWSAVS